MAQQTAVEWFEQNISKYIHYQYEKAYEQHDEVTKIFEQAKQMEKEQIIKTHLDCWGTNKWSAEAYYNKTYGENKD